MIEQIIPLTMFQMIVLSLGVLTQATVLIGLYVWYKKLEALSKSENIVWIKGLCFFISINVIFMLTSLTIGVGDCTWLLE